MSVFSLSKDARVGWLITIIFILGYFGFSFLKGNQLFSKSEKYLIKYNNVDGLVKSNAVMLNGLQVGKVENISILAEEGNKLLVTLKIDGPIDITEGSQAILADNGFLGGKNVVLKLGNSKKVLESGSFLIGGSENGITNLIKEKTLPLLSNVDSLIYKFRELSAKFDSTGLYLNKLLVNSNKTISTVGNGLNGIMLDNRNNLKVITGNLNTLSANLIETEKALKPLLGKFSTVADSLNALQLGKAVDNAQVAIANLNKIVVNLENGKGTAGKLLNNDALYNNLNKTMLDIDQLIVNLKEEPKRYVHFSLFGKKNKKEAPKDSVLLNFR